MSETKAINVPILARVEGEGALELSIDNDQLNEVHLRIYEPPRLFEKFLEGREPNEVIDAVARICGICPIAYQMSAVHAIESIFNMQPGPWVREMRRLFYCGEWLESHAVHVHLLAAPDFFGFPSAVELAKKYPKEVKRGLRIHALGNSIMSLLGKRAVNPVGACVGGFYHAPSPKAVSALLQEIEDCLPLAKELLEWTLSLELPTHSQDFTCVSLNHPHEYPINEGRIVSNKGLAIDIDQFDDYFQELHVDHSTALHSLLQGKTYCVGPIARVNLNYDLLPNEILSLLSQANFSLPTDNMYHSMVARCIEIYYAMLESIRILRHYQLPDAASIAMTPKAGIGFGATEAPRGLLWHRYEFTADGLVKSARIVPPTSQNQARMEEDLRINLQAYGLDKSIEDLTKRSEIIVRNYDPCISCSTHFLQLTIKRR